MICFGIPDTSRKLIDDFQGDTSELRKVQVTVRASDEKQYMMACGMYIQKSASSQAVIPLEEKVWQVGYLMKNDWFLSNLKLVEFLEKELDRVK